MITVEYLCVTQCVKDNMLGVKLLLRRTCDCNQSIIIVIIQEVAIYVTLMEIPQCSKYQYNTFCLFVGQKKPK